MGLAPRIVDSRSEFRLTVNIAISIKPYFRPTQHLVMADVSTAGALITGGFQGLRKGQEIIITIGDVMSLVATIIWMEKQAFGVSFHRRMHGFEFDSIMDIHSQPGIAPHSQPAYDEPLVD